jgi:phage-related minor tail protein
VDEPPSVSIQTTNELLQSLHGERRRRQQEQEHKNELLPEITDEDALLAAVIAQNKALQRETYRVGATAFPNPTKARTRAALRTQIQDAQAQRSSAPKENEGDTGGGSGGRRKKVQKKPPRTLIDGRLSR